MARLAERAWSIALGAGIAAVLAIQLLTPGSPAWVGVFVVGTGAAAGGIALGIRLHRPERAGPWWVLAAAVVLLALADLVYYPPASGLVAPIGFPSAADVLYLLAYVLITVAVSWFAVIRAGGVRWVDAVDASFVVAGIGAVSWVTLIHPVLDTPALSAPAAAVLVAYPLLDLAMLGATVWLVFGGLRRNPALAGLVVGLTLQLVADTWYGLAVSAGAFALGHPVNAISAAAVASLAAAALHPAMRRLTTPDPTETTVRAYHRLPFLLVASAVILTAVLPATIAQGPDGHQLVIGALSLAMVAIAVVRIWLLVGALDRARRDAEVARAEAEASSRTRSEFLSRMSHELRTPLNAVLGFSQLLSMGNLDEDARESVAQIEAGGRRLLSLIDDVLEFARIDAGRLTLAIEAVPVGPIAAEAIDLLREEARRRDVTIEDRLAGRLDIAVLADGYRLRQVLRNLLDNAVRYHRPGGRVWIDVDPGEEDRVEIVVGDNGPGIPPEVQDTMFVPFAGGAERTSTGLGLPFVTAVVDALGGRVACDTSPSGTIFRVSLPAAEASSVARLTDVPASAAPHRATILYIEDSLANLELVRTTLTRHRDVRLLAAMRAASGIELAAEHHPDLVLLDIRLPDASAEAVIGAIRAIPGMAGTPIICLSSDGAPRRATTLLDMGVRAFLRKPLDLAAFMREVDAALAHANGGPS